MGQMSQPAGMFLCYTQKQSDPRRNRDREAGDSLAHLKMMERFSKRLEISHQAIPICTPHARHTYLHSFAPVLWPGLQTAYRLEC